MNSWANSIAFELARDGIESAVKVYNLSNAEVLAREGFEAAVKLYNVETMNRLEFPESPLSGTLPSGLLQSGCFINGLNVRETLISGPCCCPRSELSVSAGTIPHEIGQCSQLGVLFLDSAPLVSGSIPPGLGSLSDLSILQRDLL